MVISTVRGITLALLAGLLAVGHAAAQPTATFTSTPLPTATASATRTVTFTSTAVPTPTPTRTGTFTSTPLPTATASATRTVTFTSTALPTPTFTPTLPLGLSIGDVAIVEGDSGTRSAVFAVQLRGGHIGTVRVTARTMDGTAGAPSDYEARSEQLVFATGQTLATFPVAVRGDRLFELSETFTVQLINPLGAPLGDPTGVGTILNDERDLVVGVPELSPADPVTAPDELTMLTLRWTHPERWRALRTVDLRLVDGDLPVLWVRFDEAANTFALCAADGACGPGAAPGSGAPIAADGATFHPAESAVRGSGPTGPSVDLVFAFSLAPVPDGDRVLRVESAAVEDTGAEQGFLPIGYLQVIDAAPTSGGADDDGCAIQPAHGGGRSHPLALAVLALLALRVAAAARRRPREGRGSG